MRRITWEDEFILPEISTELGVTAALHLHLEVSHADMNHDKLTRIDLLFNTLMIELKKVLKS